MARRVAERVKELSVSTGLGPIVLSGTPAGTWRPFSSVMATGDTGPAAIVSPSTGDWEVTEITMRSDGALDRQATPYSSSNGNALVDFRPGVKEVYLSPTGIDATDLYLSMTEASAAAIEAAINAGDAKDIALDASGDAAAAVAAATAILGSLPPKASRYLGDPANWIATRDSRATCWDLTTPGNSQFLGHALPDQLIESYGFATKAYLGKLVRGPRANLNRAIQGKGIIPGVLGSGGQLPTVDGLTSGAPVWLPGGTSGLSTEVVGNVTAHGMTGVRIRYFGTATATAHNQMFETTTGSLPVTPDRPYCMSVFMQLADATLPPNTYRYRLRAATSGGSVLNTYNTVALSPTPDGTIRRYWFAQLFPNTGTIARSDFGIIFVLTNGGSYDFTCDFFFPALEEGWFPSDPMVPAIPSTTERGSRAQDIVDVFDADLGGKLRTANQGTLILTLTAPGPFAGATDADWLGLISFGDGSLDRVFGLLLNPAHTTVEARWRNGASINANASVAMTPPTAEQPFKVALSWDASKMQVAARGAAGAQVPLTAPRPTTHKGMLGRYATGNPGFCGLIDLDLQPAAFFDATLAALTL